jgi:hypothetical protein
MMPQGKHEKGRGEGMVLAKKGKCLHEEEAIVDR